MQTHAASVLARAETHEGDPVAMAGIHVRLNLEHEAAEFFLQRLDLALASVPRQRTRRVLGERGEQLFDAEIVDGGAEEHGRLPPGPILCRIERVRSAF